MYGTGVGGVGDSREGLEAESTRMGQRALRRLPGVASPAVARQESEADIHVFQGVALDEAAHAEGGTVCPRLHAPEAETVLRLHGARALFDVVACRVQVPDAP